VSLTPAFPLERVVIPRALAILSPVAAWAGWPAPAILHRLESARRWWWVRSWASFCVEDFSLDRFRSLDESAIRARCAAFAELLRFDAIRF